MPETADPTHVVADADVLAADVLVGGAAREALDIVRSHSWLELLASDTLLSETRAVIADLSTAELAADWHDLATAWRVAVEAPEGDHPALAAAYHGGAAHLLSFDEGLTSAAANRQLASRMAVSVRQPEAFSRVFDAGSLYEATFEAAYPGPDTDPRG